VANLTDDELRWLSDQIEIRNLLATVAQLADDGDLADYADCFTADAVWVPPGSAGVELLGAERSGIADMVAGAQERRDAGIQGPGTNTRHVVSSMRVVADGPDRASGRTYWRYYGQTDATPQLLTMGHYDDEFARSAQGWRIAKRTIVRG
jgi:3-phenylpropionate/cinnamic acid dioxygenase small subunit